MKIKISKGGKLKELLPLVIQNRVIGIAEQFRIAQADYQTVDPDKVFVVGEGESYFGFWEDGREASFEVVSQNTIGASGLSYSINSQFSMPNGTYLVRVSYYTRYWMDIYKIQNKLEVQEYAFQYPELGSSEV